MEPAALVKLYAGERFVDVMTFAVDNGLTPIAGADPHVGVGGWYLGGGHGPLTGKYGMGADQVVEMEVVTADGVLRTVNAETDSDLFWALRGVSGLSSLNVHSTLILCLVWRQCIRCCYIPHRQDVPNDTHWTLPIRIQHNFEYGHFLVHGRIFPLANAYAYERERIRVLFRPPTQLCAEERIYAGTGDWRAFRA